MSPAQIISLRHTFQSAEAFADAILEAGLVPSLSEALRRARLVFESSPAQAAAASLPDKGIGRQTVAQPASPPAPAPTLPPSLAAGQTATPAEMAARIQAYGEAMQAGPELGWKAAKSLLELATFDKRWGMQAHLQLLRVLEGSDLASQRTLVALGTYPYAAEVDQAALRALFMEGRAKRVLQRWASTPTHPLRGAAAMFVAFFVPSSR